MEVFTVTPCPGLMFSWPHKPGSPDVCRPGVQAQRETPASLRLLGPVVAPSTHGRGICGLLGMMRCPLRRPPAPWEETVPGMAASMPHPDVPACASTSRVSRNAVLGTRPHRHPELTSAVSAARVRGPRRSTRGASSHTGGLQGGRDSTATGGRGRVTRVHQE